MPPAVRHLTPADLAYRLRLIKDDATEDEIRSALRYLADLRSKRKGPPFMRSDSGGRKAKILYREADVEAWEESRLVGTREPA